MKAMDVFHTYADWKAQQMQNTIGSLLQCKVDYDQLQAQCEELKKEVNMIASERAQREVRKKEVCVYIYLLTCYIQT
jgi:predicted ATP-grasp superfamily ATP-dependent carboligase